MSLVAIPFQHLWIFMNSYPGGIPGMTGGIPGIIGGTAGIIGGIPGT